MSAPPSEAHRLARPPVQRRAAGVLAAGPHALGPHASEIDPCGFPPGRPVPFAALATLLGLTVRGTGAASYTFRLTGTCELAVAAAGTGAYRTSPTLAMRMHFEEFAFAGVAVPGGMEERIVDGAMYVRSGLSGPEWTQIPLGDSATGADELDVMLARARQVDPPVQLALLISAGSLRRSGAEKLGGVRTTRYAGELTPQMLAAPLGAAPAACAAAGVARVAVDVWVDGRGRARRLVALAPTGSGQVRMALTFDDAAGFPAIEAPTSF